MAKKNEKPMNKLEIEKSFADLNKLIESQNFNNIEELQAFLNQIQGKRIDEIAPQKKGKKTNEELAQDLLIEAYDAPPNKAKKLLDQALLLDPNNADIYLHLANFEQKDVQKAIEILEKGLQAGKNTIGEANFKKMKGSFWGFHETRPYMRVKANLASTLAFVERYEEAIAHYQEMMVLNPNDNQGNRYALAVHLVHQNKEKEYTKLYKAYNDDCSALWLYTYALFLFKKYGLSPKANDALIEAYDANPYVVLYFIQRKKLPNYMPSHYGMGDENEAIICVFESLHVWAKTDQAIWWVLSFAEAKKL